MAIAHRCCKCSKGFLESSKEKVFFDHKSRKEYCEPCYEKNVPFLARLGNGWRMFINNCGLFVRSLRRRIVSG